MPEITFSQNDAIKLALGRFKATIEQQKYGVPEDEGYPGRRHPDAPITDWDYNLVCGLLEQLNDD